MKWAAVENREEPTTTPVDRVFSRRPRPTRFNERASSLLLCLGPPVGLSTGGHSRPLAAQGELGDRRSLNEGLPGWLLCREKSGALNVPMTGAFQLSEPPTRGGRPRTGRPAEPRELAMASRPTAQPITTYTESPPENAT